MERCRSKVDLKGERAEEGRGVQMERMEDESWEEGVMLTWRG